MAAATAAAAPVPADALGPIPEAGGVLAHDAHGVAALERLRLLGERRAAVAAALCRRP